MTTPPASSRPMTAQAARIKRYALILSIIWTLVIVVLGAWALYSNYSATIESARTEARATFEKDLVYRRWAAMHGGVYVPVTEQTPPNPYLTVPNRDVTTIEGLALTLVNPAYMTRQVHELAQDEYGTRGHITSLDPIRPANVPDAWEAEALRAFEAGNLEVSSIETVDGAPHLRYMHAMITEQSCLACHAEQGYELGDVRGGISVAVPMQPYWDAARSTQYGIAIGHTILWALGLAGIGLSSRWILHGTNRETFANVRLRESEMRYRALFEQSNDAVFIIGLDGRHIAVNHRATDMLGYSPDAMVGMNINELSAEAEASSSVLERLLAGERVPPYERWFRRRDGSTFPVEISAEVVRDHTGQPLHVQSIARDISARKQMEDDLRHSEEKFRSLIEQSTDGVAMIDEAGRIIEWNRSMAAMTGISAEAAAGRYLWDVQFKLGVPEHQTDANYQQLKAMTIGLLEAGSASFLSQAHESVVVRPDGTRRSVQAAMFAIKTAQGCRVGSILRDYTERKEMEEALRESEARLRAMIAAIPDMMFRVGADGTFLDYHAPDLSLLFDLPEVFLGEKLEDVLPPSRASAQMQAIEQAITSGEMVLQEFEIGSPQGEHCLEMRVVPAGSAEVLVIARDVTELRQAQQRELALALERERVQVLTNFIQHAAHEFRTPLGIINSNAYLMAKTDSIDRRMSRLAKIEHSVRLITRLVDMLLLMVKLESSDTIQRQPVDMVLLVESICRGYEEKFTDQTTLHFECAADTPPVLGDMDYLVDALRQLLDNAHRFTPAEGTVTVRLRYTDAWVHIDICDTGPGIPPDAMPHIFDTFWRNDEAHTTPGLGLGLTIAHKIIALHGGTLTAESEIDQGTCFQVTLPVP